MEKVIRDGKVAVLVSPGYGAGWSTWNSPEYAEKLLYHPKFVEAAEAGVKDIREIAHEVLGGYVYDLCLRGWDDIEIEWLPVGTIFRVDEYDGFEGITTCEDLSYRA